MNNCPFCHLPAEDIIAENELAQAFYDKFPVNAGHVLITPKRHVAGLFEANREEMDAMTELLLVVKELLQERFKPDGYNVGVNVGAAAGQTIFHLHMHMIPRYQVDVTDPRGGVRKIKPSLVPYLQEGELEEREGIKLTQSEAVIYAFKALGGERSPKEIEILVNASIGPYWKDFNAAMADMVPLKDGGNSSSTVPGEYQILERVTRGIYRLK